MGKRTKAHAVKFTDADWSRIEKTARKLGMTPAALVNYATGFYIVAMGERWDGLLKQGRPEKKANPQKQEG